MKHSCQPLFHCFVDTAGRQYKGGNSMRNVLTVVCITAAVVMCYSGNVSAEKLSRTEEFSAPAKGIRAAHFKDLMYTDFSYRGIENAERFSVSFERTVKTDDQEEFEEIISELDLEITSSGGVTTFRLIHPEQGSRGIIDRLFDRREWRIILKVTGPAQLDYDISASFSGIHTSSTMGAMTIDADFGDTTIRDHAGVIDGDVEFGSFRVNGLEGSFEISGSFSDVDMDVLRLDGNSGADISFGSLDLNLPRDVAAEIRSDKSFGSINFRTQGATMHSEGYRRILGDGGPVIDLEVEFGEINVRNTMNPTGTVSATGHASQFMPLNDSAWWRYTSDGRILNITVEKAWHEKGLPAATITLMSDGATLSTIDVVESSHGLMIAGIDGDFFGREIDGVRFDPPRLWLSYSLSESGDSDYILGNVRGTKVDSIETPAGTMKNVLRYVIRYDDGEEHVLCLAPGIGIVTMDSWRLESYNSGVSEVREPVKREPKPRFEQGALKSIRIRGERLLTESEVLELLDLTVGKTYTRAEIAEAVRNLDKKHRFIVYAGFDIDIDGNLDVHVQERQAHTRDLGLDASFERVGGVGIGPELTITSLVGPLSEIDGAALYHFANKEWTYRARAEKSFFTSNRLAFGGTYRLAYESSMDWAIPQWDGYLNAFLFGLETNHYHEVEGSTGYVSFLLGSLFKAKAEYFEEEFSSLKKHTNWSVFNHRHVKDDNLPLAPVDEGRIVGYRIRCELTNTSSLVNTGVSVEAEQSLDRDHNTVGEYTRYLGNAVNTWKLTPENYLKIRLAGGYSEDSLPAPRAFNLGGLNTLRGYDFQSIPGGYPYGFQYGGNRMVLANVEYLIGEEDDIGLIVFADAGGVWMKGQEFDLDDLSRDVGVSLAFDFDFFPVDPEDIFVDRDLEGMRVNWAVPVGNVPHVSNWTVNFARAF